MTNNIYCTKYENEEAKTMKTLADRLKFIWKYVDKLTQQLTRQPITAYERHQQARNRGRSRQAAFHVVF